MKNFKQILSDHGMTLSDISIMFGYKTPGAFRYSSARKRIEKGIERLYDKTVK